MRELKFRAWDKIAKKYYKVVNLGVGPNSWQKLAENRTEPPYQPDTGKNKFYPGIVEVEQYTGLNDKNGKEIYEGDIVRLLVSEDFRKKFLEEYHCEIPTGDCQVFFECGAFMINQNDEYYLPLGQYKAEEIEIIGNIHENPELLKKEK